MDGKYIRAVGPINIIKPGQYRLGRANTVRKYYNGPKIVQHSYLPKGLSFTEHHPHHKYRPTKRTSKNPYYSRRERNTFILRY